MYQIVYVVEVVGIITDLALKKAPMALLGVSPLLFHILH